MGLSSDRLKKMVKQLEDEEADIVSDWIVECLLEIGIKHRDICAMNRPRSQSANCDCGRNELVQKILRILDGYNT